MDGTHLADLPMCRAAAKAHSEITGGSNGKRISGAFERIGSRSGGSGEIGGGGARAATILFERRVLAARNHRDGGTRRAARGGDSSDATERPDAPGDARGR